MRAKTRAALFCPDCARRKRGGWACRDCGKMTCGHYCGAKDATLGVATCGSCLIKNARLVRTH